MTRILTKPNFIRLVLVLIFLGGVLVWLKGVQGYSRVSSDFSQDYFAVIAWQQGSSIFTPGLENLASSDLQLSEVGNYHPPTQTLLYLPLGLLPYRLAFVLWSFVSLVAYLALIFLVARETELPPTIRSGFLAISLYWYPFVFCTNAGQSSVLITAAVVGGWLCFRRSRSLAAGICLAVAALFKLFPGLLLFYILLKRDWKALISFVAVIGLGTLMALLVFGSYDCSLYYQRVVSSQMGRFSSFLLNHSLSGIMSSLFTEGPYVKELLDSIRVAEILRIFLNLSCLFYVLWQAVKLIKRDKSDSAFCLFCVAMLLLSPLTWMHIFVLMLLPLCWLYRCQKMRMVPVSRAAILAVLIIFSLPDVDLGRELIQYFAPQKIPVYAYLLYRTPTFALLYLGYLLTRVNDSISPCPASDPALALLSLRREQEQDKEQA